MATKYDSIDTPDKDWRAESDLNTLATAEEIKGDAKRYKAALALAKQRIADLQDLQDDAVEEGDEESKEAAKAK